MEAIQLLVVMVSAPILYFGVGLPWSPLVRSTAWSPLLGIAVLGLAGELAYIGGLPVRSVLVAVIVLHGLVAAWQVARDPGLRASLPRELADFGTMYLVALVPFVFAPFSTPGVWTGDWFEAFESAEHIRAQLPFPPDLLARPVLFGAASVPMSYLGPGLPAFQAFGAVASACALQVFRSMLPRSAGRWAMWLLGASLFFLQVTLRCWPKFLCAAFLLAAWEASSLPERRRAAVMGLLAGLALAAHQSAILFAPLFLLRLLGAPGSVGARLRRVLVASALVIAVVAPWELYTIQAYGWAAKVHANPAVSMRLEAIPAWLNAVLVGASTLAGWGPLYIGWHWVNSPDRFTLLRCSHELYWLVTATFNSIAGSLLGIVLPWWGALGGRECRRYLRRLRAQMDWRTWAALAFAFLGQMLLNPFYSSDGSLQTGWVPVGLALALWFARELTAAPAGQISTVIKWTVWLGAAPWVLFQGLLTAALVLSPGFRRSYVDTDLQRVDDHHWTTLGLGGFPWIQGLFAGALVFMWLRRRRASPMEQPMAAVPHPAGSL